MSEPAVIDASCEANGHPTSCTEPAPGTVTNTTNHNVTITAAGTTREIATIDSADMYFSSHAHKYSDTDDDGDKECHQNQSHSIDPDTGNPNITIDGSPIYLVENNVTTDPGSGGPVDITNNPMNTRIDS